MCRIYEFDFAIFLSTPRLARKECLKKTGMKLDLFTNVYMLLMVEKELEVEYVM